MAEKEEVPTGLNWHWVPHRFHAEPAREMPNFLHGLAGIAATLALAGTELDRPDLTDAAARGAEHLVTLGRMNGRGCRAAHHSSNPAEDDLEFAVHLADTLVERVVLDEGRPFWS